MLLLMDAVTMLVARLSVTVTKVVRVKALLLMLMLMMVMKVLQVIMLLVVLVKEFVVEVEAVFLASLSSPSFPRTRPAARVWASGAKGLGFQFAAPAPGRRCSGPFSCNTAPALVRHGVGCAGPVRVDPAHQNEHRVKPRGVRADTVESLVKLMAKSG